MMIMEIIPLLLQALIVTTMIIVLLLRINRKKSINSVTCGNIADTRVETC